MAVSDADAHSPTVGDPAVCGGSRARRSAIGSVEALNRCIAASTPSARMQLDGVGGLLDRRRRAARARPSGGAQHVVGAALLAPGGLPTPMRTRTKSSVLRCCVIDRRPLWPARPPPTFTRTRARRQVELVVDDHELARVVDAVAAHEQRRRPRPSRSCRSCGKASATRWPPIAHLGDEGRSLRRASGDSPWRRASTSTTSAPTLWRVPRVLLAGVAQPDDQQVGRACPAARAAPRPSRRHRRGYSACILGGVAAPRPALALGAFALGLFALGGRRPRGARHRR